MRALLRPVIDILFPPKCVFCRRLLPDSSTYACALCQKQLPVTEGKDVFLSGKFISTGIAPLWYKDMVRSSVLRFKFGKRSIYARAYGHYMAQCVVEHLEPPDIITWVPVSRQRLRSRGYDQAQLLAQDLAGRLDIPLAALLIKTVDNPAQSSLKDKAARRANVLGVYRAADPELMAGKCVLLVDDVFTTGSTASECSRVLLTAGAKKVNCVVFARR